MRNGKREKSW